MEEIIFNVKTNTGNTVADLKKVNKEEKELKNNADAAAEAVDTQFDSLNKKVALGGLTFKETSKAIKEYQSIALQAGLESPIGKAAIANASQLKDDLRGLGEEVNRLKDGGAGMQAALQLGSTVTAGYGALQGTMALVGGEQEDLEKGMQKLLAVQTVLSSIEAIRAGLEKESFLMLKANVLWTNLQAAASNKLTIAEIAKNGIMGITTAVTGAATVAMAGLNAVMMLNPVFLLIAAFAAIAGTIAIFASSSDHAAEDNERLNDSIEKSNELMEISNERMIRTANNRLKQAQAEGASEEELLKKRLLILKTEENARQKNMTEIRRQGEERIKVLKQAIVEGDEDTQKAAEEEIRSLISKHKRLKAQDGQYYADKKAMITQFHREQRELEEKDAVASLNAQILQARGNFGQQQKLRKELAKQERDQALADGNLKAGERFLIEQQYEQKVADLNKEAADKAKTARADRLAKDKEAADKRLELERLISDLAVANISEEWQRRFTELSINQQREREDLIKKFGQNTELLKQLQIKQSTELMALDEEQRKAVEAKEKEEAEKLNTARFNNRKARIEGELIQAQSQADRENEIKKKSLEDQLTLELAQFDVERDLQAELALLDRDEALKNKNLTEGEKFKIQQDYQAKINSLEDQRLQKTLEIDAAIKKSREELFAAVYKGVSDGMNLVTGLSDAIFSIQQQNAQQATQQAEDQVKNAENALAAANNASAEEKARLQENVDAAKAAAYAKQQQEEALAKKKFEIDKKLQIAQAAIQGVQAVLAAYSSGSAIPVVGAVTGPLFAALAAATVIAQIAKIKNSSYQGTGSSIAPPSQSTPNLNSLGSNGTTDTAALQNGSGPNPNGPPAPAAPLVVLPIDSLKKVQDQSNQSQQIATIGG